MLQWSRPWVTSEVGFEYNRCETQSLWDFVATTGCLLKKWMSTPSNLLIKLLRTHLNQVSNCFGWNSWGINKVFPSIRWNVRSSRLWFPAVGRCRFAKTLLSVGMARVPSGQRSSFSFSYSMKKWWKVTWWTTIYSNVMPRHLTESNSHMEQRLICFLVVVFFFFFPSVRLTHQLNK